MTCQQCQGIEDFFGRRQAERQLSGYRKSGPDKTTCLLIDALQAEGVDGLTLLDIGGGIGTIQVELLKAGVTTATDVDASTGYIATARTEAKREGLADRITYRFGNFVDIAPELTSADVVTLDRVICCYHDMNALVGQSTAKATKFYGLVYPRDSWWTRLILGIGNVFLRRRGSPFRVFVHPSVAVNALIRSNGLAPRFHQIVGFWQVAVYARPASSS